jgi:hypothetical protein
MGSGKGSEPSNNNQTGGGGEWGSACVNCQIRAHGGRNLLLSCVDSCSPPLNLAHTHTRTHARTHTHTHAGHTHTHLYGPTPVQPSHTSQHALWWCCNMSHAKLARTSGYARHQIWCLMDAQPSQENLAPGHRDRHPVPATHQQVLLQRPPQDKHDVLSPMEPCCCPAWRLCASLSARWASGLPKGATPSWQCTLALRPAK